MDSVEQAKASFRVLLDCDDTEKLSAGYDKMAPEYETFTEILGWVGPAETAKKILELEPNKNIRILDVGCGTGLVGTSMWEAGYRNLHGVDLSKKSVDVANERDVYTKLIHSPFGPDTPLTYQNGFFDMAVSTGCFVPSHLNESHLPEMIRLVKQGGYLIIITRKIVFEDEEGDMKLKTGLSRLVKEGILQKISHDDVDYRKNTIPGIALCYQVN